MTTEFHFPRLFVFFKTDQVPLFSYFQGAKTPLHGTLPAICLKLKDDQRSNATLSVLLSERRTHATSPAPQIWESRRINNSNVCAEKMNANLQIFHLNFRVFELPESFPNHPNHHQNSDSAGFVSGAQNSGIFSSVRKFGNNTRGH